MIDKVFVHCSGIGPKTDEKLRQFQYNDWQTVLNHPDALPVSGNRKQSLIQGIQQSLEALNEKNLEFLISRFPGYEHWRFLAEFFDQCTFFDIETTGLSCYQDDISVISAFYKQEMYTFVYQDNLDEFLDLVDESTLLVAFNGNSFDVPFIESYFNIPNIGCPYIDLRWIAYHFGFSGGLKNIEKQFDLFRPAGFEDTDGFEAVRLFNHWQKGSDRAKEKLINYCQLDVLASYLVALELMKLKIPGFKRSSFHPPFALLKR